MGHSGGHCEKAYEIILALGSAPLLFYSHGRHQPLVLGSEEESESSMEWRPKPRPLGLDGPKSWRAPRYYRSQPNNLYKINMLAYTISGSASYVLCPCGNKDLLVPDGCA
eukprot:SAG11_NODE_5245_length_1618_cov_1.212640_2_plen_110_part_00